MTIRNPPNPSLASGRHYVAIPGPSVLPDRVLQAMHRPAPNIYAGEMVELAEGIYPDLKAIARTAHNAAIYIANGHGAWEAVLANTLSRGDQALVLGTGLFGPAWAEMARQMGIDCQVLDFDLRSGIDFTRVAEALEADKAGRIKAVLAIQVDTSTSVRNDIVALRKTLDSVGHPALLFSDNIASLGIEAFEMDSWGVDVMVAASQKGLMTPPGLAFVYFNDRADHAREKAGLVTSYWDWRPRVNPDVFYRRFCGTAPTHHLYGLRAALDMLEEEGLEAVWSRHATLARAVWSALEVWGQGGRLRPYITERVKRSHAVTTVDFGGGDATRLRYWMESQFGVTLGIPIGEIEGEGGSEDDLLRIGHMGHVNAHMVMGVLAGLQAGMSALDIPHDPTGLEAAMNVIAEESENAEHKRTTSEERCCG